MTRRPASPWPRAAALVLAAALGVAAAGCQRDDGFGEATERAFMRACVQDGDAEVREVCECSYRRITREMSFSSYRALDRKVRDDPDALPGELLDIVAECGAEPDADD